MDGTHINGRALLKKGAQSIIPIEKQQEGTRIQFLIEPLPSKSEALSWSPDSLKRERKVEGKRQVRRG